MYRTHSISSGYSVSLNRRNYFFRRVSLDCTFSMSLSSPLIIRNPVLCDAELVRTSALYAHQSIFSVLHFHSSLLIVCIYSKCGAFAPIRDAPGRVPLTSILFFGADETWCRYCGTMLSASEPYMKSSNALCIVFHRPLSIPPNF